MRTEVLVVPNRLMWRGKDFMLAKVLSNELDGYETVFLIGLMYDNRHSHGNGGQNESK